MSSIAEPLVTDIDGTLIFSDPLWESALRLLKRQPHTPFLMLIWLLRRKAHLKHEIARRTSIDVETLPYNRPLLEWIEQEKRSGRLTFLATASNVRYARAIASHLKLFDTVFASASLLLYWIRRMWLLAHRGLIKDDPVLFTINDGASRMVLFAVGVQFAFATL